MKLAAKLTVQGLIRALRARVHGLAEDVERGQVRAGAKKAVRPGNPRTGKGENDGVRRG
ncbi:MAG: hypothetical protein M9924_01755 [Rhizobiaceae bacterium]|nr:hypothetical protein [Rhizobiaceae bacterium]